MKRLLAILLGLITCFSCVMATGCGDDVNKDALVIEYYKAGYGEEWIINLAAEFQRKTGQEVIALPRSGDQGVSNMSTTFKSGTSETDLFFTKNPAFGELYQGQAVINGVRHDTWYADISDVFNATIEGENITVKDKMFDAFEAYYRMPAEGKYYDNKYYFFPWVTGMLGIVMNVDVWNQVGQGKVLPRTTDEFLELCASVKSQKAPFIFSLGNEYFTSYYQVFMNQYEGNEGMDAFYKGYGPDGDRYSQNMIAYAGFERTLEFFEELLRKETVVVNGNETKQYVYMHKDSASLNFQQMQGSFLNGEALFSMNGDWLENEMKTKYPNVNLAMIKTPVLSTVIDNTPSINDDATLRAVIDYVDGKTTAAPAGVTQADIDYIAEARSVEYVTGNDLIAYVPVYSNQIPAAKEFLKFMASDEGMRIFRDGTSGCELPFTYTNKQAATKVTGFRQSINSILDVSTARFVNGKDKIFALGGVNVLLHDNSYGRFADAFSNGKTAAQYFEAEVDAVNSSIDQAKQQANIK